MFKSAATKIAHNSTLPALALSGNKDLRPLRDLITAEKVVLVTLQKLRQDFTKAMEALRVRGMGEGDDLGDILTASTTVFANFSAALSGYATREHAIRDHLKAIRTREEALDELKRRRKATLARADSAEKKLNKMGPEHKNLAQQTDVLNQLQMSIRQMDGEIMTEEAALGNFKRTSAHALMGLKFGGLMECCEKGCVVAEVGRTIVSEISEETTTPSMSRTTYVGHQPTQQRVIEAERCVNEIVFSVLPPASARPPRLSTNFAASASERGEGFGAEAGMEYMGFNAGGANEYGGFGAGLSVQNTGMTGISQGSWDPAGTAMRNPSNLAVEEGGGDRQSTFSTASEDFSLAYMNMGDDPEEAPFDGEGEKERQARLSKRVKFRETQFFMEPPQAPPFMKCGPSS